MQAETKNYVFFLVNEFSMIAFSMAIEPLRIANRMVGHEYYKWRLTSLDGEPVTASNGIVINADTSLSEERRALLGEQRPDMMFICAGENVERYNDKSMLAWVRETFNRGVAIGGMCTGAYVLAKSGILTGKSCAIHWENLAGFTETFPEIDACADLYEVDGNLHTCAGGTASLDMMLSLIGDHHNDEIVARVCQGAITDRVRSPKDRQRLPLRARLGVQNSKVLSVIEFMEANLSEPLSLAEIAKKVGLSRRQIERLFRTEMGRPPARYYLEIRLDRARHLLMQSSLPIVEVAIACGFISASHFSKCYRETYHKSPQQERVDR
ncbi:MAG: GlxA family transcriptional regulator [Lentilitoribacter sp.]